jgi:acyl-CoA synthetase (AMP-forming)/AMP-acid ligase II
VLADEHKIPPKSQEHSQKTVGLLCTSSVGFIITYLGLMRLGYVVLLIASVVSPNIIINPVLTFLSPQLEPLAIEHLCGTCGVEFIFVDELQSHRATQLRAEITMKRIPDYLQNTIDLASCNTEARHVKCCDPAHIFHTSGTSTGLPKPIVQSHWGAVGALACLTDIAHIATFSTTPLYHGGLADCFRSWTSASMVWFFPEGVRPVTSANIVEAVMSAREASVVVVKYFTGVPYILQTLADEEAGVQLLQTSKFLHIHSFDVLLCHARTHCPKGTKWLSALLCN